MAIEVRQNDLDAAWRLLQRVYTPAETSLPMLVFGAESHPMPPYFEDPQHPRSKEFITALQRIRIAVTTNTIVSLWRLTPEQVDALAPNDQRIIDLRQILSTTLAQIPRIAELRSQRVQIINGRR